jgi:hypothetical protein
VLASGGCHFNLMTITDEDWTRLERGDGRGGTWCLLQDVQNWRAVKTIKEASNDSGSGEIRHLITQDLSCYTVWDVVCTKFIVIFSRDVVLKCT